MTHIYDHDIAVIFDCQLTYHAGVWLQSDQPQLAESTATVTPLHQPMDWEPAGCNLVPPSPFTMDLTSQ